MLRACVLAVLAIVVVPSFAHADEAPRIGPHAVDRAATQAAMEDYFAGEIRGGYVLVGLGLGGLVSGALLSRSSSGLRKGLAYPLLTVGVLHVAAGIFVGVASSKRVDKFTRQIEKDPAAFIAEERPRMAGVSRQFTILKIAELTLIAGGLTMAGVGWRTDRPRLQGAGLAIALEMALTFGFDVWAAGRAHDYRDRLGGLDVQASIEPATGAPVAMITHAGVF